MITPSLGMGGMERVLINYANLFARRGYEVTILNLTYHDEMLLELLDKSVKYQNYYTPVKHISKTSFKDFFRGNFRLRSFQKWVERHSARFLYKKYIKEKFDIEIAFFGGIATKIVSGSTNQEAAKFAWIHSANIEGLIKDIGGEKEFCQVYNAVEQIICVSKEIKQAVESLVDKERLYVLHNPQDTEKIRRMAEEYVKFDGDGLHFINVSRLDDKSKGFMRLLDVCKKLNEEGFSYHLWIVGDGIDAKKIQNHACELELRNVHFLGQQSNPYKYIRAADFYVCSSHYEGFSMTMMEAVILGKPIITTHVSGTMEMLDDGRYGMIVENSAQGLYEGLKQILFDQMLRNDYKEKAEQRKNYFNEEEIINQFEAMCLKDAKILG